MLALPIEPLDDDGTRHAQPTCVRSLAALPSFARGLVLVAVARRSERNVQAEGTR